jgi:hypothetical protein
MYRRNAKRKRPREIEPTTTTTTKEPPHQRILPHLAAVHSEGQPRGARVRESRCQAFHRAALGGVAAEVEPHHQPWVAAAGAVVRERERRDGRRLGWALGAVDGQNQPR